MPDNLKQAPIPAVSRTMRIVNPDGTVTRSGQLLLEQLQPAATLSGPHGSRPEAGDTPDGSFYVDSDYGVIYQNQDGVWRYIAGTMYGTLTPDQRPTDLGVNDGGFDFRVTDPDAANKGREFIWSGADWIETTPVRYGTHAARLATSADGVLHGTLWVETDRNNIMYQVQRVAGAPAWVYLTGAMYGTIIAADQRPAGLGANDTGLIFLSSDSTSVRWNGGSWDALDRVLDIGPAPPTSQLVAKANGAGALSLLCYQANAAYIGLAVEVLGANWIARDVTSAWIGKEGNTLIVTRSAGNTPGSPTAPITSASMDLTTGIWTFQTGIVVLGAVNTAATYQVFGNQVVTTRQPGIAAPAGGSVVDVQARAAIQSIINAMSFAAGGHGLIG